MAIKDCKECGKPVSTEAKACPHCGADQPKPTSRLTLLFAGLVLIFVLKAISTSGDNSATSKPAPTAADIAKEKEFQQVVSTIRHLKNSMKNPAAFELVSALMTQGPTLCLTYRSTNSFNAVITDRYVVSDKVSSGTVDAWNKYCGGKSGTDYTYARRAI
jgi:RNA polymerase subunit RPABC4/transcription elongation factor Spt4